MNRPPKWIYLMSGILIVMSLLLGGTIMHVLLYMLPHGMDIQIPLQFIILPLTVFIIPIVPIFAFVLTRNKEQSL